MILQVNLNMWSNIKWYKVWCHIWFSMYCRPLTLVRQPSISTPFRRITFRRHDKQHTPTGVWQRDRSQNLQTQNGAVHMQLRLSRALETRVWTIKHCPMWSYQTTIWHEHSICDAMMTCKNLKKHQPNHKKLKPRKTPKFTEIYWNLRKFTRFWGCFFFGFFYFFCWALNQIGSHGLASQRVAITPL